MQDYMESFPKNERDRMEACDLLFRMSRDCFSYLFRQLGHTLYTYIYGTPDNGEIVEHEKMIRTMSSNPDWRGYQKIVCPII